MDHQRNVEKIYERNPALHKRCAGENKQQGENSGKYQRYETQYQLGRSDTS